MIHLERKGSFEIFQGLLECGVWVQKKEHSFFFLVVRFFLPEEGREGKEGATYLINPRGVEDIDDIIFCENCFIE